MPHRFGATPRDEIVAAFRQEADTVDHATAEPAWFLPLGFNETDLLTLLDILAEEAARGPLGSSKSRWAWDLRIAILARLGIEESF